MAARTPAGPTRYIDTDAMIPRQQIVVTGPNQAIDDQHYYLDRDEMLASFVWNPIYVTADAATDVVRFHMRGADLCGASDGKTRYWCVRAWTDNLAVGGTLRLWNLTTAAGGDIVIAAATTTKMWRGWGTTSLLFTGADNDMVLRAFAAEAGTKVFVAGLGIYAG